MSDCRPFPASSSIASMHRQRGMTMWGLIYVLFTAGLLLLVGIKAVPVYLNAYDIRETIEWAAEQPDLMTVPAAQIQSAIQRRFDAGYVDNVKGRDVAVSRVAGGGREISIAYEVRRPLMFDVSLVFAFEETAPLTGTDGG
ncbi:DUF4845 domain-containing protein [Salinisphaera dokdonensis]